MAKACMLTIRGISQQTTSRIIAFRPMRRVTLATLITRCLAASRPSLMAYATSMSTTSGMRQSPRISSYTSLTTTGNASIATGEHGPLRKARHMLPTPRFSLTSNPTRHPASVVIKWFTTWQRLESRNSGRGLIDPESHFSRTAIADRRSNSHPRPSCSGSLLVESRCRGLSDFYGPRGIAAALGNSHLLTSFGRVTGEEAHGDEQ